MTSASRKGMGYSQFLTKEGSLCRFGIDTVEGEFKQTSYVHAAPDAMRARLLLGCLLAPAAL